MPHQMLEPFTRNLVDAKVGVQVETIQIHAVARLYFQLRRFAGNHPRFRRTEANVLFPTAWFR